MPNEHEPLPEEMDGASEVQDVSEIQKDFAKKMQAIASDLWGAVSGASGAGPVKEDAPAARTAPANRNADRGQAGKATLAPDAAKNAASDPQEALRARLHCLWQTADETIDWTDALGHAVPTDGLTPMHQWRLYHRLAPKVLEGDQEAYVEVLTTTNPLGDLTDFVEGMVLRTPGADRLECRFECRRELMDAEGERYLCALGLRIARDLLATLPVSEVYVEGNLDGRRCLGVTYPRRQLLKRNPIFLDPVAFTRECGGLIDA